MNARRLLREGLNEHHGLDKTVEELTAETREREEDRQIYTDYMETLCAAFDELYFAPFGPRDELDYDPADEAAAYDLSADLYAEDGFK